MTVLDADGHVTETAQQLVKYMDAPYRNRQLSFPLVPSDGWDRRLITKFHDSAGTAEAWLEALDRGAMEQAVLFPQALKLVGENQIVYASDYPHWDHSFPGSIDEIRDRGDLTDTQKRKVLADNCRKLYKL